MTDNRLEELARLMRERDDCERRKAELDQQIREVLGLTEEKRKPSKKTISNSQFKSLCMGAV